MHAVDLDNGAPITDIPAPVLERLLGDITAAWQTRGTDAGLLIRVDGTDLTYGDTSAADSTIITGSLPAVVQWAAGRGTSGITAAGPKASVSNGAVPAAKKWI